MTIDIKKEAESTLITVAGRLDTVTAPALEQVVSQRVEPTERVTLALQGLEYISSAGLRVLLGAQKKLQAKGQLKLTGVTDAVMEVLEMTGFSDILTIE